MIFTEYLNLKSFISLILCDQYIILIYHQFFYAESIKTLQKLLILRIARNDLEVVHDLTYLKSLKCLTHLRIDENPFSLLERTVPFAIFCISSLDTINGNFIITSLHIINTDRNL